MKKLGRFFLRFLLVGLLLTAASFFLLAFYYRDNFLVNTWINGVYCTGKTVEEVNQELSADAEAPVIRIAGTEQVWTLDLAQADYHADYSEPLKTFIRRQNPFLWVQNVVLHTDHTLLPEAKLDEDKLKGLIGELEPVKRQQDRVKRIALYFSEEAGWQLENGLTDRLDTEALFDRILESVADGSYEVSLSEDGCLYDMPPSAWETACLKLWDKIDAFQQCGIVYDMGDRMIPLKGAIAGSFLALDEAGIPALDENGELSVDEKRVGEFIAGLADEYDTYGKDIAFQSTRGDTVLVPGNGTYGTTIDQEAEFAYLTEALKRDSQEVHIPSYVRQGVVRGKNDIGSTYIEVDMTEQKMYYYEDGSLILSTDVVTGNTGRRMGTPEGVNYVYDKQQNRVLRGRGYATPVKYWMPVKGAIGIHDASWRSEFGGEIYKTNGSHGCVNTPLEVMRELYDKAEIGTPVVIFY